MEEVHGKEKEERRRRRGEEMEKKRGQRDKEEQEDVGERDDEEGEEGKREKRKGYDMNHHVNSESYNNSRFVPPSAHLSVYSLPSPRRLGLPGLNF